MATELGDEYTPPDCDSFYAYNMSLKLNFFPYGLPKHHLEKQTAYLAASADRTRRTLRPGERLITWVGEYDENIVYGPPRTLNAASGGCHCGCGAIDGYGSEQE
jgi:hypothetical protein